MRLGISAEALRRRLDRGEARGFERDGTSFVYVSDLAAGDLAAERRFGGATTELPPGQAAEAPPDGTLPVVVEFQKMELTRLLRENERLNTRLDHLFDEIHHLRDMQQREQVLRQQEQALRRQIQETLDRVASRPSVPPPSPAPDEPSMSSPSPPRPELVLNRTVVTKRPSKDQPKPTRRPGPGYLTTGRSGREFAGSGRREPHAVIPKVEPRKPVIRSVTATPAPAPASRAVEDGAIRPEEAAELAVILNDIGQSLRDSEAFRRYPPIKPGPAPQRAGDRRPASALPGRAAAPTRVKGSVPESQSVPESLSAEEAALVAIFDSMGPTAEDRRNAARSVRRLLRSRRPPQAGEP